MVRIGYNAGLILIVNAVMTTPRLAWAITGSGHYIEECLNFVLTLDNVDLYLSQAAE